MEEVKAGWGGHRMRMGAVLGLLAIMPIGCAIIGLSPSRISPEERGAYDRAVRQLSTEPRTAESALIAFLDVYPRSSLADDAAERLANLAFAAGREDEGLRWLGRILSETPDADREPAARLRLAQFEYARDRMIPARRLLEPLRLETLPLPDQRAALRLRVALAQTPVERLSRQSELRLVLVDEIRDRGSDFEIGRRLTQRLEVLEQQMSEGISRAATPELELLLDGRRDDVVAGRVLTELARRALERGEFELAIDRIEDAEMRVRSDTDLAVLRGLRDRLGILEASAQDNAQLPLLRDLVDRPRPRTSGGRGKIGVVLPLSGRFASFGEQSLRGLLLAADLFEAEPAEGDEESLGAGAALGVEGMGIGGDETLSGRDLDFEERNEIRLIVRDSEGDPDRAAAMVRELAADSEIAAILGPIFTAESMAAAEAAERAGVPLVSLNHREEVSSGRSQVFRTRTTPADEVSVLVDHAFNVLGAKRFAVLYPRNRYGRGMRKLYWDAVRARGGKMVAASSYDREATDFSRSIKDMIGYRFITEAERVALKEREETLRGARYLEAEEAQAIRAEAYAALGPDGLPLPPIVDFDVLFIPDSADKVSLIAPGLAYHEVRGVDLLGTSGWLDGDLLKVARRHVSGAVISTPFYAESNLPFVSGFVDAFRQAFGEEPDSYAAQAFDAGSIVLVQLAAGREGRREIRDGLLQMRAFPGATGALTMRPDGNARRRPFLLGVKRGRFTPLD